MTSIPIKQKCLDCGKVFSCGKIARRHRKRTGHKTTWLRATTTTHSKIDMRLH